MNFEYKKHVNRIFLFYFSIPLLIAIVLYFLLPTLLNYPPDSIDNLFQKEFDGITYSGQYVLLIFCVLIISLLTLYLRLKKLKTLIKKINNLENNDQTIEVLNNIRHLCLNTPYLLYYLEIFIPLVILPITFIMIKAYTLTIIKICIIYISFFTLGAVMSFVSSQSEFKKIMISIHNAYPDLSDIIQDKNYKINKLSKSLYVKLLLQILPLVIISLVFTSLVSYTQASKKTGDIYYNSYKTIFNSVDSSFENKDDIMEWLKNTNLLNNSHIYFIIDENGNYITSDSSDLQPFFIKYTIEKSQLYEGRTYDYFCLDREGIAR